MIRRNKIYLVVGRKFTGKTSMALTAAYKSGQKICVVDTDDHPAYNEFKLWRIEDLHLWTSGNIKLIVSDPGEAVTALNKKCSNAFVICEDSGKYITSNIKQPVKNFIIDHRKRNFDIIFMFHFLAEIPPYLCKQYDHLILFHTGDNLKTKLNKFANWHKIVKVAEKVNKSSDIHYSESINMDE